MSPPNLTVPRLIGAKEGILAVYKPAGMLAHPSAEAQAPDLISWLRSQGGAGVGILGAEHDARGLQIEAVGGQGLA